ncbi:MAG: hypothetical protein PHE89_07185 [Alphaproteobacteria bacterium]|nr:hypothetical protein [Alphaproteobacteria bacterium]
MKKTITITAFTFLAFLVSNANAQTAPSCSALGYTETAASCQGKNKVACPTNESLFFCGDPVEVPVIPEPSKGTCEDKGYIDTATYNSVAYNAKKCTSIQVPDLASGTSCYTNCTDAPQCSSVLGKGNIGADAKIEVSSNSDGTCNLKKAGSCTYAGYGPSATRLPESYFSEVLKYFSSSVKVYTSTDCGATLVGTKIAGGKICVAWQRSSCGSGISSVTTKDNQNLCYKCMAEGDYSIANYFCYQSPTVVRGITSNLELCTETQKLERKYLP